MKTSIHATAFAGVFAVLLAGCTTFSARPDASRFFTLSALSQPQESAVQPPAESPGISLGIGPVSLPGYLDRQEIVTRIAQNQVNLSENDRWAEPLEESFTRVVSQNISNILRAPIGSMLIRGRSTKSLSIKSKSKCCDSRPMPHKRRS